MRRLSLALVCVAVVFFCLVMILGLWRLFNREKQQPTGPQYFSKRVGNGHLVAYLASPVGYICADEKAVGYNDGSFFHAAYMVDEKWIAPTAGYFKINGKLEALAIQSTNPEAATVRSDTIWFHNSGKTQIKVSLAGKTHIIPVEVVAIPVQLGMTDEQVLKTLGFPDGKWWYENYWGYNIYPGAVLDFSSSGKLSKIGNAPKDVFYSRMYDSARYDGF